MTAINHIDENVNDNDTYIPDVTDDNNAVLLIGTGIEATAGANGSFGTSTLGTEDFVPGALHDSPFSFGTRTFTHALGWILDGDVPTGSQTFDQAYTGTFDADTHCLISVSGFNQVTSFKESAQVSYSSATPADITYDIDDGGLAVLVVCTNINAVDQTAIEAEGWSQEGASKSLDIISDYRIFTRIATADELGTTVTPAMTGNGTGRGFARVFVFNGTATAPDTTAPVLTSPTASKVTSVGSLPSVTTDEDNGTCYMVVVPDGDTPSVAQIKAGQQSSGAAAVHSENILVSATGSIEFDTIQTVAMDTTYDIYFVHTDASNNDSSAASVSFTTLFRGLTTLLENYILDGGIETYPHGANNTSGSDLDEETNRWGAIRNNAAELYEYDPTDLNTIIRTVTLNGMDNDSDCEGMCYLGRGELGVVTEGGGRYQLCIFDLPEGTTDIAIVPKQILDLAANDVNNNSASESLAFNKATQTFYVTGEGEQPGSNRRFFTVLRPGVLGRFGTTDTNHNYNDADDGDGWSLDDYISEWDAEIAFDSLGVDGSVFDLAGMAFDQASGNVIIVSDTGGKAVQVDVTDGTIISEGIAHGMFQCESVAILVGGDIRYSGEPDKWRNSIPNTVSSITKDFNIVSDLRQLLEKDYVVSSDFLQLIEKDFSFVSDLLQKATKDYNLVIDILGEIEKDYELIVDLVNSITKDYSVSTDLIALLQKDFNVVSNFLALEQTDYVASIDLLGTLVKDYTLLLDLLQEKVSDYVISTNLLQALSKDYNVNLELLGLNLKDYVVNLDLLATGTAEKSFNFVIDLLQTVTTDYNINTDLLSSQTTDYVQVINLLQAVDKDYVAALDLLQIVSKDFVISTDLLSAGSVEKDFNFVVDLRGQIEKTFAVELDLLEVVTGDFNIVTDLLDSVTKDFIAQLDFNAGVETSYTISLDCIGRLEKTFDVVFSMGDSNLIPQHYLISVGETISFKQSEPNTIKFSDDDAESIII